MARGTARTLLFWLALGLICLQGCSGVSDANCYMGGAGGWDLEWWGESPRLPLDGTIPLCIKTGVVNFKWRSEAGIFQIPAPECPASYDLAANDTYKEIAPVSDSGVFALTPDAVVGSYFFTSQVPGACESGVLVQIDVIGGSSGSGTRLVGSLVTATLTAATAVAALVLL